MECRWWAEEDWENLPEDSVLEWTTEWGEQDNGFACDRCIFFLGTTAFCASSWDGTTYTWMTVASAAKFSVRDSLWESGDVRVLLSYV